MNIVHHTKNKGDIAEIQVTLDLVKIGCVVSKPMSEHAPYDLVADKDGKLYRVQVKYRSSGMVPYVNTWSDRKGLHVRKIDCDRIDVIALVFPDGVICYCNTDMLGKTIRRSYPKSFARFYYYEDFRELGVPTPSYRKVDINHKTYNDVCQRIGFGSGTRKAKIQWPSKEELSILVWEKPTEAIGKHFNVSGSAVAKKCKALGISKPPRGYWQKLSSFNKALEVPNGAVAKTKASPIA